MARSLQSKRAGARSPRSEDGDQPAGDDAEPGAAALPPGLYLAATPIGAAADVTLRALDALARADVIAAEDTRRAKKLMTLHGVSRAGRPIVPYHDHNGAAQRPRLLARVAAGESVVCVSDAGTPLVADPGWKLAKEAIAQGLSVFALPGASALLAALTVAGLPTDRFMFAGFPPPKQAARRADLAALATVPATLVFYESARRLGPALADMAEALGPDREAAVCRELTKLHEETRRGALGDLAEAFSGPPPKGEIVICVGPPEAPEPGQDELDDALRTALKSDRLSDAARDVAATLGLPKRVVYARALTLSEEDEA